MVEPRLAERKPPLQGLRVLVVGLGRSGLAAARLARARGARVTIADRRDRGELELLAEAEKFGARIRAGGHPKELAGEADLLVLSPGVPAGIELVREARRLDVPVWGEIELATRFCSGRVIGITGSNGKSTVTSMTGRILRASGVRGGTGGNLDTPFCDLLVDDGPDAVHALELSSFQLETVETLRPEVALVLNLSPDHLDRYASYDDYARAKARLLELQQPDAFAVLNADDAESGRFQSAVRGRLLWFSVRREVERGAFVRDGRMVVRTDAGESELFDAADLPVPGEHNLANALAAALACILAGCPAGCVSEALRGYRALSHRLEQVGSIDDVLFFNDSKATNPAAAAEALGSFEPGKVHLILGGKDKGTDWGPFAELVRRSAKRVLLVGRAADTLRSALEGIVPLVDCGTVRKAVETGFRDAEPGEVVLLSPACASFDQYRNFEERGEDFRQAVREIETTGGRNA